MAKITIDVMNLIEFCTAETKNKVLKWLYEEPIKYRFFKNEVEKYPILFENLEETIKEIIEITEEEA